jgi:hypothetical protein
VPGTGEHPDGTVIAAVLGFLGVAVTGLFAFIARRTSTPVELSAEQRAAFRDLMLQSENVILRLTARNDELTARLEEMEDLLGDSRRDRQSLFDENLLLQAEVRQVRQMLQSHLTLLGQKDAGDSMSEGDS